MNVKSQRSSILRRLALEPPILMATLLTACLGGASAWATTGVFSVVTFVVVAALGLAAQVGLSRLKPYLPWIFTPLLVFAVYWSQIGWLDWTAIWPALIVAATWLRCLPAAVRFGNRGYVVVYVLLLTGVAVGGAPVWCLLSLLPAPLAWRMHKSADTEVSDEWAIVTEMFLVVGYVIKGLIR